MILHSPTENENRHGLTLTVILNAVKDLLYVFDLKRITSRFFVAEFILSMAEGLLRMTLRQVRETGGKPTTPIFEGAHEGHEGFRKYIFNFLTSCSSWLRSATPVKNLVAATLR
jgi:hypothetical protein